MTPQTIGRGNADVEHERAVAIFDLIEQNHFKPAGHEPPGGQRRGTSLLLGVVEGRLVFTDQ